MKKRFFNRWLVLILIVAIIIPHVITHKTEQVLAAQTGTVTATMLNVRAKPSMTAEKVMLNGTYVYLKKGEKVNILGAKGDFYQVSLKFNGKTVKGYVHKDFVSVTKNQTPTTTPKPTATPKPSATPKPTVTPKPNSSTTVSIKKEIELKGKVAASSLNVRSGPGTSYTKVSSLRNGTSVTVIREVLKDDTEWYGISYKSGDTTIKGYVLSSYIKLSYTAKIKGEILASKLKIRSAAGSKAAYLKNSKGSIISLSEDKSVTITGETMVSGIKWLKLSFSVSGKKYSGYAEANQVGFVVTETKATPTPVPSPTPSVTATPKPTLTPTPKVTPTPNPSVTPTPIVTETPNPSVTPTPTISPTPTPGQNLLQISNNPVYSSISQPMTGYVCNTVYLNVIKNAFLSNDYLTDSSGQPVILQNKQKITVTSVAYLDGTAWYNIMADNAIYGYVLAEYIYLGNEIPTNPSVTVTVTPTPTPVDTSGLDFETKLTLEGFPESYKASLRQLHAQYPQWEFKAYHTGLDWNTAIASESISGKNLIPNSYSVEWKSLETGAYNWKTDSFIVFDGSTWVTASKAAIEFYMDPRNFLTKESIFQFEQLKYQSVYQNVSGIENVLKGTALYNSYFTFTDDTGVSQTYSYAQTFLKAAEYSGVSPYHLASRVKQEVVTGPTSLSNSVTGSYSGYEGLYNFYNIGASDSAGGGAIANGLKYAKNGSTNATTNALYLIPWTNPYRSIVGGSHFIGGSYINRGQDTIYLQKFNVTSQSTYYHQYMSNVQAPYAEAKKILTAYNGMADSPIVFSIPVYLNMPQNVVSKPTTMFNPNNRMKSLMITNAAGTELPVTPSFSQTEYNYSLIVPNDVATVQVTASTVSKKATLGGGGYYNLNVGTNTIEIPVIAENGDIAKYTINVVRE